MWSWIRGVAGAVIGAAVLLLAALIVSMRTKWEPGLRLVRRLGRDVFNRAALRTAGLPGASAHVIRHRGRRSGKPYRTPIGLTASDDGWLVMLPYGTTPDWLKNVLTAGEAEVEIDGGVYTVTDPWVAPRSDVAHLLSPADRLVARVFGVDDVLRLRRSAAVPR